MNSEAFLPGSAVRHGDHGTGRVIADQGATVVVRFGQVIQECARADLVAIPAFSEQIERQVWDVPLEVMSRLQAEAITSVNDAWGVFARSRIALLPHQLWVCREVLQAWPARWLVADDVGLGKTIEAGILLTPLIGSGRVRRLLVLCPASLVEQWQQRLRTMFDVRLAVYTPEADTDRTDFWHTHNQVVVSLHTLRADHRGRHERLLDGDPWDLVLVDESHHLNADEDSGPTLAYQLVKKLNDHGLIQSMIFFTGTPHRGKTFGFLAQLHLLRPDLFDPRRAFSEQVRQLPKAVIRNNKHNVTDLRGKPLFQEPLVSMETYSYSDQEQAFYDALTDFIVRGRAYASGLSSAAQSAVSLVLISMQKLASSSVAAIRRAVRGRLARLSEGENRLKALEIRLSRYDDLSDPATGDARAKIEEEIAGLSSEMQLMEDEEPWLRELLVMAEEVKTETKIEKILELVKGRYSGRSVLFFTEYKATQSLLMSSLIREFGDSCVGFINGDRRADDVVLSDGTIQSISLRREDAADAFNNGKIQFLVSTEAAGEGIDLQSRCHTLIHVDLPWNPMRLHQRVGRLDRYGQSKRVEVVSVRNPSTVEARIMQKLEEKLDRITAAFSFVMDSPEDLKQLVLGMAPTGTYQSIFADAIQVPRETLSQWFDKQTAMLGGEDAVDAVRALVGDVRKFDFAEASERLPRVDLPDLIPFFEAALGLNGRRPTIGESGMTFLTPDEWRTIPAVRTRYEDMSFDRQDDFPDADKRLLGVGHRLIDQALEQARQRSAAVATLPTSVLAEPLIAFRVMDRVTDGPVRRPAVFGVRGSGGGGHGELLRDWELLKALNELPWRKDAMKDSSSGSGVEERAMEATSAAEAFVRGQLDVLAPEFRVPDVELIGALFPASGD